MIRTRDFVLFLLVVVFLLVSIAGTILNKVENSVAQTNVTKFVDNSDANYSAEVYEREGLSRESRLAEMKNKIDEGGSLTISNISLNESDDDDVLLEDETSAEDDVSAPEVINCPDYKLFSGEWPRGVKIEISEGSRIFYIDMSSSMDSASTSLSEPELSKRELLKLPLYPTKVSQSTCLSSDVIGVALGGSLIRNSETGLYRVFGGNTVVGFSLDGFAIFGLNNNEADTCGGALINGQYGYFIKDDQVTILSCFSGKPVTL